jgi:hypothetical protein
MRNKVAEVYASYFIALCAGTLLPAQVMMAMSNMATLPCTLAFSNTPGILR